MQVARRLEERQLRFACYIEANYQDVMLDWTDVRRLLDRRPPLHKAASPPINKVESTARYGPPLRPQTARALPPWCSRWGGATRTRGASRVPSPPAEGLPPRKRPPGPPSRPSWCEGRKERAAASAPSILSESLRRRHWRRREGATRRRVATTRWTATRISPRSLASRGPFSDARPASWDAPSAGAFRRKYCVGFVRGLRDFELVMVWTRFL
jgi:hypothetical protein